MPDLLHFVPIDAPAEKAFEALTTRDGLRGWWTADAEAEPKEGSDAVFGFDGRQVVFRMRVAELVRNERVRWECVGDQPE